MKVHSLYIYFLHKKWILIQVPPPRTIENHEPLLLECCSDAVIPWLDGNKALFVLCNTGLVL